MPRRHRTTTRAVWSGVGSKGDAMRGDKSGVERQLPSGAPLPNLPSSGSVIGVLVPTAWASVSSCSMAGLNNGGPYG
jgi:hypothetical protein